jgi:hypothetical protein
MSNPKIFIEGIQSGDILKLSDNGRTEVNSESMYRKITWTNKAVDVKSFRILGKAEYSPFETNIPKEFDTTLSLKVNRDEPQMEWAYTIEWNDLHDRLHVYDPLIAIKSKFLPGGDPGKGKSGH